MTESPHSTKIPISAVPSTEVERRDWLRLIRSRRVGPATFIRLIREHGNAASALAALPSVAAASGVSKYTAFSVDEAMEEIQSAGVIGARMLCLGAKEYPALLATIPDPPPVLWALGSMALTAKPMIALVGARNSSSVGRRMAARLAAELSEAGYVVVSGMARGIDTEAHRAALSGGTVAVLAGGVDNIYPAENTDLAQAILENGVRLSEMPLGMQAQSRHFPRRNRIISGLSQAVVVIEGAARSGSLITARDALDQGREVMAVPGSPIDGRSAGCNMLIRDGATLVRGAQDIIEALQRPAIEIVEPEPKAIAQNSDRLLDEILSLLSATPVQEDVLIRQIDSPARDVLSVLSMLEFGGQVERQAGGLVAAAA